MEVKLARYRIPIALTILNLIIASGMLVMFNTNQERTTSAQATALNEIEILSAALDDSLERLDRLIPYNNMSQTNKDIDHLYRRIDLIEHHNDYTLAAYVKLLEHLRRSGYTVNIVAFTQQGIMWNILDPEGNPVYMIP